MKKKLVIFISIVFVLALIAVPTYAAITDKQKTEIEALNKQVTELRKQIVDKYAEAGDITKEQAEAAKSRIDALDQYRQQNGLKQGGMGFGPGFCANGGNTGCGMFGQGKGPGFNSSYSNR